MPRHAALEPIDAAVHLTGLVLRAVAYMVLCGVLSNYACGQAILTGIFAGDLTATVLATALACRDRPLPALGELVLLGLVWLWVRSELAWPDDPASVAIAGLSAFGVFSVRSAGDLLTRLRPDPDVL